MTRISGPLDKNDNGANQFLLSNAASTTREEANVTADILNSWKEIAAYLGRGVRTVQRWEQELELPVRRPRGTSRSAVLALKSDLDRWVERAPLKQDCEQHVESPHCEKPSAHSRALITKARELAPESSRLVQQLQETVKMVNEQQLGRETHPKHSPSSDRSSLPPAGAQDSELRSDEKDAVNRLQAA